MPQSLNHSITQSLSCTFNYPLILFFAFFVISTIGQPFGEAYGFFENISWPSQLGRNDLSGTNMRNAGSLDFNNDGLGDLIITFDDQPGRFYWGVPGNPNFGEIHDADIWVDGIAPFPASSGIIFADFDNDGDLDFYAPNSDPNYNHQLFMNTGDQHFEDVTDDLGIYFTGDLAMFNQTINGVWGDYDGDSYVDLLLIQSTDDDEDPVGSSYQLLLHNDSGNGFSEAINTGFSSATKIVSALWADFDLDHDLDLLLVQGSNASGGETSKYLENNKDENGYFFHGSGERFSAGYSHFAHHKNLAAVTDMNNDGLLDVVFYNSHRYGILASDTPNGDAGVIWASQNPGGNYPLIWDIGLFDANLDGVSDMLVSKYSYSTHFPRFYLGCEETYPIQFDDVLPYPQPCGSFVVPLGENSAALQKGFCVGDFDHNGTPEFFLTRRWTESLLYGQILFKFVNTIGNWVSFTLGSQHGLCNASALGATVILTSDNHTQAQMVDGGSGRASQSSLDLTFGLGDHFEPIDVKAFLPNKDQVADGSIVYLRQVPSGQYWKFDLDGILDNSIKAKLSHNASTGNITMSVVWYTYDNSDDDYDQVSFYSSLPGAIAVPQEVYFGNIPIVPFGDEGYFRHEVKITDLPCEAGLKLFFTVQSKSNNTLLGSSMHSVKPAGCLDTGEFPIPQD